MIKEDKPLDWYKERYIENFDLVQIMQRRYSVIIVQTLLDLYEEIKHGDEEHQKWLYDKIQSYIKDHTLPSEGLWVEKKVTIE